MKKCEIVFDSLGREQWFTICSEALKLEAVYTYLGYVVITGLDMSELT